MARTIPPVQAAQTEEGIVQDVLTGLKAIPHLPNALTRGVNEEGISPEEQALRKRALSEAAFWVLPVVVTPVAAGLMKAAPALVRGILSGAAGLAAGEAGSAAAKDEDILTAAARGAAIGAGFGTVGGLIGQGVKRAGVLEESAAMAKKLEEEAAAAFDAQRKISELGKQVRSIYKLGLTSGIDHDDIVNTIKTQPGMENLTDDILQRMLGPGAGKAAAEGFKPIRPRGPGFVAGLVPKSIAVSRANKEELGQALWVKDSWPSAEAYGLSKAEFVNAARDRGIAPNITLKALGIPKEEWANYAPELSKEINALNAVMAFEGRVPDLSATYKILPRRTPRSMRDPLPRPQRPATVEQLSVAPERAVESAAKAGESLFTPFAKGAAAVKASIDIVANSQLFDEATMLVKRALAPSRAVLMKLGPAGGELADKLDGVFRAWRMNGGEEISRVRNVLSGFSKDERIHIGEIMEGLAIAKDPKYDRAAERLADIYSDYKRQIESVGIRQLLDDGTIRKFRGRDMYLTHYHDENIVKRYLTEGTPEFEKAMAHLKELGVETNRKNAKLLLHRWLSAPYEFRTGPINFSRSSLMGDVPYEKDPLKVMSRYIYSVQKRLELSREFGPDFKKVLEYYNRIGEDGFEANVAKKIFDAFAGATPREFPAILRATSLYNTLTMLSTAGVVQPSQLLNTAARVGYANLFRAIGMIQNKANRDWVVSTGAHLNEIIDDLVGVPPGDIGKFWVKNVIGLEPLDKANRVVSALAGKLYAEQVAERFVKTQTPKLAAELTKLGIDPQLVVAQAGKLTNDQMRRAAFEVSTNTQFASTVMDLPQFRNSVAGQLIYQFKSFALQQTYFLQKEILKPAIQHLTSGGKRGSMLPLIRYSSGVGPAGYAIGETVRAIKGRPAPDDPIIKQLENITLAGGFGVFADVWRSMEQGPGMVLSLLTGPTGGEVAQYLGADIPRLVKGDPEGMLRHILRRVPLIGQPLANYWVYPPK